ncbi:MAG: F0F1 ATP synthase subunit epsilon [Methylovirgula sp.]
MRLLVTTPTAIIADRQNVVAVRAEDTTGSFGILEGHADFLTALTVCVIAWRERDGVQRFCAVRHGVFSVRAGKEVAIATREALVGDDLDHLEGVALAQFRQDAEEERASRTENLQLQMAAVRQIIRFLRPQRSEMFGAGP